MRIPFIILSAVILIVEIVGDLGRTLVPTSDGFQLAAIFIVIVTFAGALFFLFTGYSYNSLFLHEF